MKIAFIINSLEGGGAERVIQTLANYLVNQNHEIYVFLLNEGNKVYEFDSDVKIILLKTSVLSKGLGKILFIPLQSIELQILLSKFKIKYAISFLIRANLVFSFTKFFSTQRVIISERSFSQKHYDKKNIKNSVLKYLIKKLYSKANLIISISNGIKESLIEDFNIEESKIKVIYNPQDLIGIKNNTSTLKLDFEKKLKYFITIGRLVELKDHKTLINAFKAVNEEFKNTRLLILGEGPLRSEIQMQIDNLNLKSKILLLGFVKNPYVYLKNSDIFVFSSKFEGFGNVLVEAMTCGLPVISTNCISGPSEILDNGNYGMLTPVSNVDAMENAMKTMLKNNNLKKFKEKSLHRASDFDVEIIANKYLNILKANN